MKKLVTNLKPTRDFLFKIQKSKKILEQDKSTIAAKILPTSDRKNVLDLKILIGVDVSGSIQKSQFEQFMKQVDAIRGLSMVKVIEIDTRIIAMYDYFLIKKSKVVRLGGGGGTEFSEFFKKSAQINPDVILFFTDGYVGGTVSDPGIPVGWVLTKGGKKPYDFGEVILNLT